VKFKEIMKYVSTTIYYKTQSIINIVLWLFTNVSCLKLHGKIQGILNLTARLSARNMGEEL
jgi:hypothetical protein